MAQSRKHVSTIYNPRYKDLIKSLVNMRRAAGLRQEDMAEALGLAQPDISKIERCVRRLDALELLDWLSVVEKS